MNAARNFSVIVVTGLSGSGKSTALKVFEDLGFFVVDGLPVGMTPKLVALFREQDSKHRGLVLGLDLRQIDFPEEWRQAFTELKDQGVRIHIVFLEARLSELVRRYATTRRPHPLESQSLGLEQALEAEKVLMDPLRKRADLVLDTTDYSIHDLRRAIQEKWTSLEQEVGVLRVHIISFGFKYGVPIESDLLFDLRFLPNPYFDKDLKPLSGKDKPVADFVLAQDPGRTFRKRFLNFLSYLLPLYLAEGRYRVTLALGCTGGRHRSVAVSELVCTAMRRKGYAVTLEHRHLELG
ncbi:MAG TPA: RNase adapter RapZ [Desulfovibrio sp.]|nr:RNase adapter RapZ [Desulfovibrio sp.]HBR05699.1 RNase adapter RapZ [Desulfovibrio sp.]